MITTLSVFDSTVNVLERISDVVIGFFDKICVKLTNHSYTVEDYIFYLSPDPYELDEKDFVYVQEQVKPVKAVTKPIKQTKTVKPVKKDTKKPTTKKTVVKPKAPATKKKSKK